jgi:hypothetical protein
MASADLLSPYGEGYCGRCAFVVGLDERGRLQTHARGVHDAGLATECPGGGRRPWKVQPYNSPKAAFRVLGKKADCPACGRKILVRVSVVSGSRLRWHTNIGFRDCPGTNQLVK